MQQQKIAVDWADFLATITGYYSKDGKLYSMPFNVSTPILYYNKDIFRKVGLGDTPPVTWPDVEAASRKILAAGAAKCGFTTPSPSWTMLENTFAWHDQPFATRNGYAGLDTRLLINRLRPHACRRLGWQKENIFAYGGRRGAAEFQLRRRLRHGPAVVGSSGLQEIPHVRLGTGQLPHWGRPTRKRTPSGWRDLWVLRGTSPRTTRASRNS
jgi:sn-glycerol 3-phosphate transport system substrate-binding protein